MEYSHLPINEKADNAVAKYCDTIVEYMLALEPNIEYEIDKDYIANEEMTEKASIIDIQSQFAFITIFPDFGKNSARASLLNRGLILAMDIEGFDDKAINDTITYSDLRPFSKENAEMFAFLLTEDLELQHQKLLH